jgi:hypothetical protein
VCFFAEKRCEGFMCVFHQPETLFIGVSESKKEKEKRKLGINI